MTRFYLEINYEDINKRPKKKNIGNFFFLIDTNGLFHEAKRTYDNNDLKRALKIYSKIKNLIAEIYNRMLRILRCGITQVL